mgnify:CR=1 FL=1
MILFRRLSSAFSTVLELLRGLSRGRNWWLIPVIVILLPFAIVFVLLQAVPVVAPFVYTLF